MNKRMLDAARNTFAVIPKDPTPLKRNDDRIIIHWDYDCFYASVFEASNPALKSLPLAVQQKQIIVTCNYEARRRGLHKLQLIRDARKICPDVIIVLGEDLTKFRDASKELYLFLQSFSWNSKVERLGFDEVFVDMTDVIDYNVKLLNTNDLSNSFFCLSQDDPTLGFAFDASRPAGHTYGECSATEGEARLCQRLILGSHLALHIRLQLEEQKGYTSSVGVSTSKLLSKLVGNVNKPHDQTTLLPPYVSLGEEPNNVTSFIDGHDIGKIPNIGFKMAAKLREYALQHLPKSDQAGENESSERRITVREMRTLPGMNSLLLEKILSGPGMPRGIGSKAWALIHGVDDTEVGAAREIPRQISIEDSYSCLESLLEVHKQLVLLSTSLINRMRMDLTEEDDEPSEQTDQQDPNDDTAVDRRRWLAHPKTLRLSTRPRPPRNPDGSRNRSLNRSFNRISRSTQVPSFLYDLSATVDILANKLVTECLMPLFRRLHPEKSGWDLSLLNVAVTNLAETASSGKLASGRDIGKMFKNQEKHLSAWRVVDADVAPEESSDTGYPEDVVMSNAEQLNTKPEGVGSEDMMPLSQASQSSQGQATWYDEEDDTDQTLSSTCPTCGAEMPYFAMPAHLRFHKSAN